MQPGTRVNFIDLSGRFWSGIIEEPGTNPALWDKKQSESEYCQSTNTYRIRLDAGPVIYVLRSYGKLHAETEN